MANERHKTLYMNNLKEKAEEKREIGIILYPILVRVCPASPVVKKTRGYNPWFFYNWS
jgi:hypothetical protein